MSKTPTRVVEEPTVASTRAKRSSARYDIVYFNPDFMKIDSQEDSMEVVGQSTSAQTSSPRSSRESPTPHRRIVRSHDLEEQNLRRREQNVTSTTKAYSSVGRRLFRDEVIRGVPTETSFADVPDYFPPLELDEPPQNCAISDPGKAPKRRRIDTDEQIYTRGESHMRNNSIRRSSLVGQSSGANASRSEEEFQRLTTTGCDLSGVRETSLAPSLQGASPSKTDRPLSNSYAKFTNVAAVQPELRVMLADESVTYVTPIEAVRSEVDFKAYIQEVFSLPQGCDIQIAKINGDRILWKQWSEFYCKPDMVIKVYHGARTKNNKARGIDAAVQTVSPALFVDSDEITVSSVTHPAADFAYKKTAKSQVAGDSSPASSVEHISSSGCNFSEQNLTERVSPPSIIYSHDTPQYLTQNHPQNILSYTISGRDHTTINGLTERQRMKAPQTDDVEHYRTQAKGTTSSTPGRTPMTQPPGSRQVNNAARSAQMPVRGVSSGPSTAAVNTVTKRRDGTLDAFITSSKKRPFTMSTNSSSSTRPLSPSTNSGAEMRTGDQTDARPKMIREDSDSEYVDRQPRRQTARRGKSKGPKGWVPPKSHVVSGQESMPTIPGRSNSDIRMESIDSNDVRSHEEQNLQSRARKIVYDSEAASPEEEEEEEEEN